MLLLGDLPHCGAIAGVVDQAVSSGTVILARHPDLVHFALAVGGFAIGTTEFATMSLLPYFARDLGISAPMAGHVISAYALGVVLGAPLIAILAAPIALRIPVTVAAVLLALVVTGAVSARLGGAPKSPAVLRNFVGGGLALAITYLIGHLVGAAIT